MRVREGYLRLDVNVERGKTVLQSSLRRRKRTREMNESLLDGGHAGWLVLSRGVESSIFLRCVGIMQRTG